MVSSSPAPSIRSRTSVDDFSPLSPTHRNEYPFPRSGSNARFGARRLSTSSSIHSIGGALDTSSNWHGLTESGQNAISTLLQPPIVRTGLIPHTSAPTSSAHKPPTARDIPPVTLTNIPHVEPTEFQAYLTQVAPLYDALQRAKENEDDGGTQILRRGNAVDDFSDLLDESRSSKRPNMSRKASLASLASSIESPVPRRRSSLGLGKRIVHAPTPLTTIPTVYFDESFHLENPRTFDVVSERSEVVRPVPGTPDDRKANGSAVGPRKALATNAILQEKLSWYMDTIEVHLISSISTASTSFFAALGSLRELHSEAADSVEKIKALRTELELLDQEMAVGGLTIVNKRRRKENLKQLSEAVQQLKSIVEAVNNCESMVESGDIEKALNAIDDLEKLISGETSTSSSIQLRDLRGATALQSVTTDIDTLRFRIGRAFETRFLDALLGDLRNHVESVSTSDTLQRWSIASQRSRGGPNREQTAQQTYLSMSDEFRSELKANLTGLHRSRHTSPATTAYREAVLREVRYIIKRPLPASNEDDNDSMLSTSTVGAGKQLTQQEKSTILARNLRLLEADDAEDLLKKVYIGIGETLRRLGTQVKVLLDVTSTLGDPMEGLKSPPQTPKVTAIDARKSMGRPRASSRAMQEEMHQALDMSNLLGQAVDIAQARIVKVLRVRSEQSIHLPVDKFLRYFSLNLLFANECEAVSGRGGTALKTVVNGHIKDFVYQLGETERQKLAEGMGSDPWNAKDFTDDDKEQLSRILAASTQDPEGWTTGSVLWATVPSNITDVSDVTASANGGTGAKTRSAAIDSESFILPLSAVLCLHGLTQFLHLNTGIPSMTLEIGTAVVSYLTLFNSRCTQLILGAGATRSAGLKNITTKHLALAAQALAFISALIPHLREFIRRHAGMGTSVSTLMGEFDKLRRAYLEHQQSIYDKLVDIMSGRATTHTKSMKLINWQTSTATGPNQYMETLTKETITLHKVLSKHLPEYVVRTIMEPVFQSYKEQLGKAFSEVALSSEEAKARMLLDVELLRTKIGGLDGAEDTAEFLLNAVKKKPVPKAAVTVPTPLLKEKPMQAPTNGTKPADIDIDSKDSKEEGKVTNGIKETTEV
ncbi:hypothetical protein PVAG01_04777 [Phlyctema vagabunda]|uniref:Vacuolar protein sorting-associated protein 54 n=1 Tax=Phlyctema vagabunda TaxID=108571 RepID=A0ABR4PI67_9HELO